MGGWAKEFLQNRLKAVGPDLIPSCRRMEAVDGHSVDQLSVRIGKAWVDVQEADLIAVSEF